MRVTGICFGCLWRSRACGGCGWGCLNSANVYMALDHDLDVFPVINKMNLPSAEPDRVKGIGCNRSQSPLTPPLISTKNGVGIERGFWSRLWTRSRSRRKCGQPPAGSDFDSCMIPIKGYHFSAVLWRRVTKERIHPYDSFLVHRKVIGGELFRGRQFIPCDSYLPE